MTLSAVRRCEGRSVPGSRKEESGSDENWEGRVIHLLFIQQTSNEHLLRAEQSTKIPKPLGKYQWGCVTGVFRAYDKGWVITKKEVEGICSKHIMKGFVFYAKDFHILCLLFKHK